MRKHLLIATTVFAVLGLFTMVACKKDPPKPTTSTPTPTTVCSGGNLCFKLDGTQETYTAEWRKIPAVGSNPERYRIYWEKSGGSENIEIDVYATATGTYNIKNGTPYAVNDAGFQYYKGSKNIVGQSGTVEITNIDNTNNTITGKFTVTASDGTTTYQVTDGNFEKVPLKP